VVRIFPARRVAEVLGFFAAILSLVCSQSGQFANYAAGLSGEHTAQAIGLASRFDVPWSPLAWAGRGLVAVGEGRWLSGIGLLLPIIALTAAVFAISLVAAQRLYYTGWASVQVSPRKKVTARPARLPASKSSPLASLLGGLLPAPVRGILVKDFLMLRRDLRNMSQLVTPLILGVIYAFLLIRSGGQPPPGRGEAPPEFMLAMRNLMAYGNIAISLFVGWSLLSRLATMGFSQEGKHYWLLKVAPVSVPRLLTAKFLVAYLPALALVWGFLIAISLLQRISLPTLAFGLAVVSLIMAGTAGLNLAFGVAGANFNWEDPRRITQGSYGCLGSLVSMAFLVTSLALFFGPDLLTRLLGAPQALGQLAGLVLGGAASLACAFIPLWLVRQRVPRLAED